MKITLDLRIGEEYHPRDKDFCATCDGWKSFHQLFFDGNYPSIPPEELGERYGDQGAYYKDMFSVIKTIGEFEVLSENDVLPYFEAAVGRLFEKLGYQAELGINLQKTEQRLIELKSLLVFLREHPEGKILYLSGEQRKLFNTQLRVVDECTDLSILRVTTQGKYIFAEEKLWGVEIFPFNGRECFYILLPAKEARQRIKVKWDGEHFVALHMNNLPPSLTSLKAQGLLMLGGGV